MTDANTHDTKIDRRITTGRPAPEASPSAGWRETAALMHVDADLRERGAPARERTPATVIHRTGRIFNPSHQISATTRKTREEPNAPEGPQDGDTPRFSGFGLNVCASLSGDTEDRSGVRSVGSRHGRRRNRDSPRCMQDHPDANRPTGSPADRAARRLGGEFGE